MENNRSLAMPVNFNQQYKGFNSVINSSGCALCCGVDISAYYGVSNNHGPEYFYNNYWDNGYTWQSPCANFTSAAYSLTKIKSEIDAGRPVAVHAKNSANPNKQHWVVAYGYTNDASDEEHVLVLDPWNSDTLMTTGVRSSLRQGLDHIDNAVYDMKLSSAK